MSRVMMCLLLLATFPVSAFSHQVADSDADSGVEKPPHIIFFLVDDLGWQDTALRLHSEGPEFQPSYRTPHLQRLAREGMVFTDAYASSPVCTPTRTSVMTGRSPQANDITYWILKKDQDTGGARGGTQPPVWNMNGLQPGDVTLPQLLREQGYTTIHAGKAHLGAHGTEGSNPENLGFDVNIGGHASGAPSDYRGSRNYAKDPENPGARVWDVPGLEKYHGKEVYLTEALALESAAAIYNACRHDRPFFLHFAPYAVHTPIIANDRHLDDYEGLPKVEAAYATMIESVDHALGVLLESLGQLGILDETLIVFTSDNGGLAAHGRAGKAHVQNHPLASGKGSALEGGTRIPLVFRWPGMIEAGTRCEIPVISHDHFPTLLKVAGAACPQEHLEKVEGVDLVPLLTGQVPAKEWSERALYWHMPHFWGPRGPGIQPFSSIRKGPWKLIYYHHPEPRRVLYHLGKDVGEKHDRAADESEKMEELSADLGRHLREIGASLPSRNGRMIPWPDALKKQTKTKPKVLEDDEQKKSER